MSQEALTGKGLRTEMPLKWGGEQRERPCKRERKGHGKKHVQDLYVYDRVRTTQTPKQTRGRRATGVFEKKEEGDTEGRRKLQKKKRVKHSESHSRENNRQPNSTDARVPPQQGTGERNWGGR